MIRTKAQDYIHTLSTYARTVKQSLTGAPRVNLSPLEQTAAREAAGLDSYQRTPKAWQTPNGLYVVGGKRPEGSLNYNNLRRGVAAATLLALLGGVPAPAMAEEKKPEINVSKLKRTYKHDHQHGDGHLDNKEGWLGLHPTIINERASSLGLNSTSHWEVIDPQRGETAKATIKDLITYLSSPNQTNDFVDYLAQNTWFHLDDTLGNWSADNKLDTFREYFHSQEEFKEKLGLALDGDETNGELSGITLKEFKCAEGSRWYAVLSYLPDETGTIKTGEVLSRNKQPLKIYTEIEKGSIVHNAIMQVVIQAAQPEPEKGIPSSYMAYAIFLTPREGIPDDVKREVEANLSLLQSENPGLMNTGILNTEVLQKYLPFGQFVLTGGTVNGMGSDSPIEIEAPYTGSAAHIAGVILFGYNGSNEKGDELLDGYVTLNQGSFSTPDLSDLTSMVKTGVPISTKDFSEVARSRLARALLTLSQTDKDDATLWGYALNIPGRKLDLNRGITYTDHPLSLIGFELFNLATTREEVFTDTTYVAGGIFKPLVPPINGYAENKFNQRIIVRAPRVEKSRIEIVDLFTAALQIMSFYERQTRETIRGEPPTGGQGDPTRGGGNIAPPGSGGSTGGTSNQNSYTPTTNFERYAGLLLPEGIAQTLKERDERNENLSEASIDSALQASGINPQVAVALTLTESLAYPTIEERLS